MGPVGYFLEMEHIQFQYFLKLHGMGPMGTMGLVYLPTHLA